MGGAEAEAGRRRGGAGARRAGGGKGQHAGERGRGGLGVGVDAGKVVVGGCVGGGGGGRRRRGERGRGRCGHWPRGAQRGRRHGLRPVQAGGGRHRAVRGARLARGRAVGRGGRREGRGNGRGGRGRRAGGHAPARIVALVIAVRPLLDIDGNGGERFDRGHLVLVLGPRAVAAALPAATPAGEVQVGVRAVLARAGGVVRAGGALLGGKRAEQGKPGPVPDLGDPRDTVRGARHAEVARVVVGRGRRKGLGANARRSARPFRRPRARPPLARARRRRRPRRVPVLRRAEIGRGGRAAQGEDRGVVRARGGDLVLEVAEVVHVAPFPHLMGVGGGGGVGGELFSGWRTSLPSPSPVHTWARHLPQLLFQETPR